MTICVHSFTVVLFTLTYLYTHCFCFLLFFFRRPRNFRHQRARRTDDPGLPQLPPLNHQCSDFSSRHGYQPDSSFSSSHDYGQQASSNHQRSNFSSCHRYQRGSSSSQQNNYRFFSCHRSFYDDKIDQQRSRPWLNSGNNGSGLHHVSFEEQFWTSPYKGVLPCYCFSWVCW